MTNKALYTITVLLLLVGNFANAQVDDYPILKESEYVNVQVNKKVTLYPNTLLKSIVEDERRNNSRAWQPVYLSSVRAEKFKNITVTIVGFAREEKTTPYTLYIVRFHDQYYYLRPEDSLDSSFLDEKNRQIGDGYKFLIERRDAAEVELEGCLSSKTAEVEGQRKQLEAKRKEIESIVEAEKSERNHLRDQEYSKQFDAWISTLSPTAQKAARIISITNSLLTAPNSVGGCGYGFAFMNNSKSKTIKYLTWKGVVINAVNDKVSCEITGDSVFSGRITGPVPPGAERAGEWDNLLYNASARELRLTGVSIVYMDGTTASIEGRDAQAIANAPSKKAEMDYFLEDLGLKSEKESAIKDEEEMIKRRLRFIEEPFNEYRFTSEKTFFSHEISLVNEILALKKEISQFERNNYLPAGKTSQNILAY